MTVIPFENPFSAPGRWWKGNLHTHTTVSDGPLPPSATARCYRRLGYDFLAITDHVKIMEPFDPPAGLLVMGGAEYHTLAGDPVRAWHFVCLGLKGEVTGAEGPLPDLLASIRENAAFYFAAHPYWSNLVEDDLLAIEGVSAMEVYNGVCQRAVDRGYSEQAWDYALACGKRLNALAVDDSHLESDFGRGWIMLRAEKLTPDVLLHALSKGLYYSTTGPEIFDLRLDGNVVSVRCSPSRTIKFMARSADGKCFRARDGELLASAEYELRGTETYLRVQVEDAAGRRAYTNPLYLESTGRS